MSQTRRVAAILAADVAGYSRLMGANEEGTLDPVRPRLSIDERAGSAAGHRRASSLAVLILAGKFVRKP